MINEAQATAVERVRVRGVVVRIRIRDTRVRIRVVVRTTQDTADGILYLSYVKDLRSRFAGLS